jgi:hypothetical protein
MGESGDGGRKGASGDNIEADERNQLRVGFETHPYRFDVSAD